jgi:hypothetical protein
MSQTNAAAKPLASRADLVRRLHADGAILTMTSHDWYPSSFLLGQPRKVVETRSAAVGLATVRPDGTESVSWLNIPAASDVQFTGPDTFRVRLDPSGLAWMGYQMEQGA